MKIKIYDLSIEGDTGYLAEKEEDCRNDVDLSAYKAARELDQAISMGKIIACPIRLDNNKGGRYGQ